MPPASPPPEPSHADWQADLAAKVRFLKQPEHYPEPTSAVATIETHLSWVFLTDRHAYKLKKPVRFDYLDFSTIDARHHNCKEELRLNRRLAKGVYLRLMPLTQTSDGAMQLAGQGPIIDWLVKMRRLPADRMLDRLIKQDAVQPADIKRVASTLSRFYQNAKPVAMSPAEYCQRFMDDIHACLRELLTPAYALPVDLVESITAKQLTFIQQARELLRERVRQGRIIEAHGDLRPEHICLEPSPVIIDCLEFKREFRLLDCADELAFLALECERMQAPSIAPLLFDTYRETTGDAPPAALVHFYMSCRASLWAKLTIWHTHNPIGEELVRLGDKARSYLRLAAAHIDRALAAL